MVVINVDNNNTLKQGWNLETTYLTLPHNFYSKVVASPVSEPEIIILNNPLAKELGLNVHELKKKEGVEILAGNSFPVGAIPIAQAYSGHQFGHFTTLGDGRAVLIGEQRTPSNLLFDIQLKGGGATPYSRGGDGRATVGPMLREYILSEAMHFLGIPTTRSLSVVSTKDTIYRDKPLRGAVLCRVAKSHIRFGTFEYASKFGSLEDLKILADYAIYRHEPECMDKTNPYLEFLEQIIKEQAELISKWMLVGFIHGVMNTDNMSIAGETIDYGPCAFMDTYDPSTVFSSIDKNGRYAYGNQPNIARWNLAVFAETLLPLLNGNKDKAIDIAKGALEKFDVFYLNNWLSGMSEKLGLINEDSHDKSIIIDLLELLKTTNSDFTFFFTALTIGKVEGLKLFDTEGYKQWHERWYKRISRQDGGEQAGRKLMEKSNPWIIPRNIEVEGVLNSSVNDKNYQPLHELLGKLANPYDYSKLDQAQIMPPEPSEEGYKTYCGT